ncbi:uncharacterized protein [Linepithema humile]|uniref:uncharacterized protein n=1 Tax=Linepithema humile TaxID=83485 RepID=UPI00351DDF9B
MKDSKFKANDWKYFLLYYSLICLKDLMPQKYIKHWLLFVYSLNIFSKTKIEEDELFKAKTALREFVLNVESLYGKEYMKYNVHLLLHIPEYVRNYGAIWAWSAFPFEHFNGIIASLFYGTQCIPLQICKLYSRLRYIKQQCEIFSRPNCSVQGKVIFRYITKKTKIMKCIEFGDELRIFGKSTEMQLSLRQKLLIEQFLKETIENNVQSFQRFTYNNTLYHSFKYSCLIKRNNSTVLLENRSLMIISDLILLKTSDLQTKKYIVLGKELQIIDEEVCKYKTISSKMFSFIARHTNNDVCNFLSAIRKKCVYIPYKDDKLCIIPLVNTLETD